MVKLKDGLSLIRKAEQLQDLVTETAQLLEQAERDRDLLVQAVVQSQPFKRWLLEQDSSSMYRYRTPVKDDVTVEDADDLTLALAFAGRAGR